MNEASPLWSEVVALAPEATSVGKAREFVVAQLARHGLCYLEDDVRLVVSELVTNAVMHAQPPVVLRMQERPHHVLVSVSDRSPHLPAVRTPRDTDAGARGLVIVDHCSCEWGCRPASDGGKSVWATFAKAPGSGR